MVLQGSPSAERSAGRRALGPFVQSVAAVPLFQRLGGVLGEVVLAGPLYGYLAPRCGGVQHDADFLRGFREGGVYRRGEGVDQLRPARVEKPQEASTPCAEVAPRRAGLDLIRTSAVVQPSVVDAEVLLALDFQRLRKGAEVYRVAPAAGRLAADAAVAGQVRVWRGRIDAEADCPTVARAAEFQNNLLPRGITTRTLDSKTWVRSPEPRLRWQRRSRRTAHCALL